MNPAFEKHAAYMAQAWRTLQDSVLLKDSQASPYVGPKASDETRRPEGGQSHILSNIARVIANHPSAADNKHCQSEGCFAFRASNSPYCAPCKQYREDANLE